MSVVLKLKENHSDKIYVIYDFKQVSDSILIMMYIDKTKQWEKLFIDYKDGVWETDILLSYTDSETYKLICDKLKFIFIEQEHTGKQDVLHLKEIMEENAAFMLGVYN